jgi:hypothetical protein
MALSIRSVTPTCTHHVATTGSDTNAGTSQSAAWRTIGKALNTLSAVGVLSIMPPQSGSPLSH